MADLLYLSVWLRDYNESNMLRYWQRVMEAFPASAIAPGIRSVTIYPFSWAETPVVEQSFGEDSSLEDAVSLASEFLHDDCAYDAEMNWDLWLPDDSAASSQLEEDENAGNEEAILGTGWRRTPVSVSLACEGPQFGSDAPEDRADIEIRLGLDSPFLPPDEDTGGESDLDFDPDEAELRSRENLQQLVEFVHRLDEILPITKRLLWCESGENLAQKILDHFQY